MTGRRWRAALVVTVSTVVAAAGCGSTGPADPTGTAAASTGAVSSAAAPAAPDPTEATSSALPSAVSGASVSGASVSGAAGAGGGGATTVVPVTVGPVTGTGTALDGAMIATVQVVVGGGQPVTVRLDTGSSGLMIDGSVVGPAAVDSGQKVQLDFGDSTASGTAGQAQVSLGGLSTSGPIGITLVDTAEGAPQPFTGTHGLLGIGTANSTTSADPVMHAPTMQLPAPADQGVLLDLTGGPGAGTLTLGPVAAPGGAVVLPLTRVTGSPSSYQDGTPAWNRLAQTCWTVGSAPANCAATDLDLGSPVIALSDTAFPSLGEKNSILPAGQAVTIATPAGQALFSATSAAPSSPDTLALVGIGEATYNTGIAFFQHAVVGIDYVAGRIVVVPEH